MVLIAVGHFDDCAVIEGEGNVEEDILGQEIGLRIFPRYIALMRHIQKQYMLEPAGSHGVWGLDDYHHIPFLLGACQLVGSNEVDYEGKPLTPERVVRNRSVAESIRSWSMFGEAVSFVYETKTGAPLAETSPMLWEISRIDSWERVAKGLLRMYHGEVLGKKPVIQHFYFGSVLKFDKPDSNL
mmetsp:Transcript_13474/g.11300  ORF Transcript_13474/g.11300 Transcript_13474/m.11300 type:complete len:184 (-) Transcript_13474:22-573(-)